MKKLIFILVIFLLSLSSYSQDTDGTLRTYIDTYIKANAAGGITGTMLNSILNDLVDSKVNQDSATTVRYNTDTLFLTYYGYQEDTIVLEKGTITSAGFNDGTGFSISGSPITSSGSFTFVQDFSEFADITESTGIKFIVTDPDEKEIAIENIDLSDFNDNAVQQSVTLNEGATTFVVTSKVLAVTGHSEGNTIATITGAVVGVYSFLFVDGLVTISNNDVHGTDTIDLDGANNFTSADDKVLMLIYDGTSWYKIAESVN